MCRKLVLFSLLLFNVTTFTASLAQSASKKSHNLIQLATINPRIRVHLVYATPHNFTRKTIYKKSAQAYLLDHVARALSNVQKELELQGIGLLIWDAYRPLQGQQALWDACPDERFVYPPHKGGKHTRGTTVDLTLVRLSDGKELEMPTGFDSFTPEASSSATNISPEALKNRTLLQSMMEKHEFVRIQNEWWHFDYKDWREHAPLAIDFDEL